MDKIAVYILTRDYYEKAISSMKSLIVHSDVDQIIVLAEDVGLPYWLPKVEVINVSDQEWFDPDGPNFKETRFSYMVLLRAALHRILPDVDMVLSMDADTIVTDNISELWDIDMSCYYVAGAKEPHKSKGGIQEQEELYINCGVMMMNLEKLRDGTGDRIIERLNSERFLFCEQDCINNECQSNILEIPSSYNVNNFTEPTQDIKIMHFAATPRWWELPIVRSYARVF